MIIVETNYCLFTISLADEERGGSRDANVIEPIRFLFRSEKMKFFCNFHEVVKKYFKICFIIGNDKFKKFFRN